MFRSVRFFRDEAGAWRRYEPWMTTLVDLATGQVLGIVDGRDSAAVGAWLAERSPAWREQVQVVAIDPSAAFRKALREHLPRAAVSVDKFHLVKLGNDMVTRVRQRLTRAQHGRRGRKNDPAWAHRMLLLRGADTLSQRAWARLDRVFAIDDPTDELSATSGSTAAAALVRAVWTSHHEIRWARATSAAARPESMTAATICSFNRLVERANRGTCVVASANVPLLQRDSEQNQRRLAHSTSTAPATGTSRTRCRRREWAFVAITPHSGQPGGSVEATVTRRPPSGRSTASMTR